MNNEKLRKQYLFGNVRIDVILPKEMLIPENVTLFEVQGEPAKKVCELSFAEDLDQIVDTFSKENPNLKCLQRNSMDILSVQGKECRVLKLEDVNFVYAVCIEENGERVNTWVSSGAANLLQLETIFVSLLAPEKLLIGEGEIILHSAYMLKDGKAVLFSAPSGTGKSTQAELWEAYRGTRQVNGDRSLLVKEADGWYACGWPICGSSGICSNEAYPIQAIVMLQQARENKIKRLGIAAAVRKIVSQVTINMWNAEFQMQAIDLIQDLVMEIPVLELECDISEEAVSCLEGVL